MPMLKLDIQLFAHKKDKVQLKTVVIQNLKD